MSEHPLAAEFDWSNAPMTPGRLAQQDNNLFWWRCPDGHSWRASPNNRVGKGSGCPDCGGYRLSDLNRLSMNCPDPVLLEQWDYAKNAPLTPEDVSRRASTSKVWWTCSVADDHRWPETVDKRVSGRGCPFCSGQRVSSTNRLSSMRPDIAAQLDEELSGFTADSVGIGSLKIGTWNCPNDPQHPSWEAPVSRRTGGKKGVGTGCDSCRLKQTSRQELRLKAELATVLPIDPGRKSVRNTRGRLEKVDMVAEDKAGGLRLILEFDGVWWHSKPKARRQDADKTRRLRDSGWTVVRIREAGLEKLDDTFDVLVASVAAAEAVAIEVLDHLASLGIITPADVAEYVAADLPRASATADDWIRQELGPSLLSDDRRNQEVAWSRMHDALVSFETRFGHCRVPNGILVDGFDLRRWIVKQRSRFRCGELTPTREERLREIPSWSFDSPREATFWTSLDLYARWIAGTTTSSDDARAASAWATNLRMRREALQARGTDYSPDRLQALAELPGWLWNPREAEFHRKVTVLQNYTSETGNTIADIKQRDRWANDPIGAWVNTWRTHPDRLTTESRRLLEGLPGWTWNLCDDAWDTTFALLQAFAETHGHLKPSLSSSNENERALASWKRNNKNRRRGRTDPRTRRLRQLLALHGESMP